MTRSPASQRVRDLLCRMAERALSGQLLMLRAFGDESGFDGNSPAYVLGGYVAQESLWEAFAHDWQLVLEMKPKIAYFKLDEALGLKGQFQHWREEARDEKIMLLNAVLDHHRPIGMTCSVKCADYASVATDPLAKSALKSPYYYLLFSFVLQWMEIQQSVGHSDKSIKFVFYENVIERKKIFEGWDELKEASYLPRRIRDLIGSSPLFEDDKKILPLQAADIISGICRRRWIERTEGLPPLFLPRRKIDKDPDRIAIAAFEWYEDSLREAALGGLNSYRIEIDGVARRINGIWAV